MPPRLEVTPAPSNSQLASPTILTEANSSGDKVEYDTVTVTKYVNVPVLEAYTTYYAPKVTTEYAPRPKPLDEPVSPWIPVAPRPQFKMYYRADNSSVRHFEHFVLVVGISESLVSFTGRGVISMGG